MVQSAETKRGRCGPPKRSEEVGRGRKRSIMYYAKAHHSGVSERSLGPRGHCASPIDCSSFPSALSSFSISYASAFEKWNAGQLWEGRVASISVSLHWRCCRNCSFTTG